MILFEYVPCYPFVVRDGATGCVSSSDSVGLGVSSWIHHACGRLGEQSTQGVDSCTRLLKRKEKFIDHISKLIIF